MSDPPVDGRSDRFRTIQVGPKDFAAILEDDSVARLGHTSAIREDGCRHGGGKPRDRCQDPSNLRIEPCHPAAEYKSEMPLQPVLHFASRAWKPLWLMRATLPSRKSSRSSGSTSKKRKHTWLRFGSCIRKPWMSSAERRANRPAVRKSA